MCIRDRWKVGADPEKLQQLLEKNPDMGFPSVSSIFCPMWKSEYFCSNPKLPLLQVLLRGVLLTQGKWYYEVTIPKYQDGFCAQLGWADLHYFQEATKQYEEFAGGRKGVGDD